jgi:hypothetical protein
LLLILLRSDEMVSLTDLPERKPNPVAGYQQNVQRNRQALSNAAGAAADLYKGAASTLINTATVVPRTVAGIATGETPITIDSNLPDYGAGERERAAQKAQRRAELAASVPMPGQEFARGVADRAVSRATSALTSIPKPATPSAPGQGGSTNAPASNAAAPAAQQQSAALSLTEPPAGSWASVGNGVAGRRNAQGLAEFTDSPEALAGAQPGRVGGLGDGIGGLSVVSGGREAMDRNLLATEIMQQTRRERSNPNYLTVVGDSSRERAATRNPLDRLVNDRANQERADARAGRENARLDRLAGGNQRIAQLQGQLEQSAQARIDNERNNRAATRLDDLSSILANPDLSPERREAVERIQTSLTLPAEARVRADTEREAAQQRTLADLYKSFVEQDSILKPEDRVPFDQWVAPYLAASGGGAAPSGVPEGMTFAGTSNGKNVYRDSSGRMFVDE